MGELCGKFRGSGIVIVIGNMLHSVRLGTHSVSPFAVGIAEGIGADAAAEVDERLSIRVAALCAAARFQSKVESAVAAHHGAVVLFNDFF